MDLILLGAGGQAKDAIKNIEDFNEKASKKDRINLIGCLDDVSKNKGSVLGYKVFSDIKMLAKPAFKKAMLLCAVGDPCSKLGFIHKVKQYKNGFYNLIHPSVKLHKSVRLGTGISLFSNADISADCVIGDHAIINYGCSVSHDSRVSAYTTLCPGVRIGGRVIVSDCVFMGINSCCSNKLELGKWTVAGAGTVLIKNTDPYEIVVGNPQRTVGKREEDVPVI